MLVCHILSPTLNHGAIQLPSSSKKWEGFKKDVGSTKFKKWKGGGYFSLREVHIKEDAAGAFHLYILPPTNATETTINTTRDNQHHRNQFLTFAKHKQPHMWLFFNHCNTVSNWQYILTKIGGIIVSYGINFPYFSCFSELLL